jgi:hypothetical protein
MFQHGVHGVCRGHARNHSYERSNKPVVLLIKGMVGIYRQPSSVFSVLKIEIIKQGAVL